MHSVRDCLSLGGGDEQIILKAFCQAHAYWRSLKIVALFKTLDQVYMIVQN